ncbi:YicC family protein, partial [bacterium]|nr:YicC family protein [bacterium]
IKHGETDSDALTEPLVNGLSQAAEDLKQVRLQEGSRLTEVLKEKLQILDELTEALRQLVPDILAEHQTKLEARLANLSVDVEPERIAQEVVLMAQKADVAEELDRLNAHVAEVRDILSHGGTCGRRLDFLMQELHREANTLGSKSIATATSQGAVNLKVIIEQMREQIQNIE